MCRFSDVSQTAKDLFQKNITHRTPFFVISDINRKPSLKQPDNFGIVDVFRINQKR